MTVSLNNSSLILFTNQFKILNIIDNFSRLQFANCGHMTSSPTLCPALQVSDIIKL